MIFSATLVVAGIALLGMWKDEQRRRGVDERAAAGRTASHSVWILLATAVVASGVAYLSPQIGAWIWVGFPALAFLASRRSKPSDS